MSFSNGSTAPILPHALSSPALAPNKLVKRTSSQRALNGGATSQLSSSRPQFPTLRRPATSHQRSATLHQHSLQGDDGPFSAPARQESAIHSSPVDCSAPALAKTNHWRPHFRRKPVNPAGEGPPAKRTTAGVPSQSDTIRRITPDADQLPTLLMATSISSETSDEELYDSRDVSMALSRPDTPSAIRSSFTSSVDASGLDRKPRRSFSITDMLPSGSPSSWKLLHSASHRKKTYRSSGSTGGRIVSAPQTSKLRRTTISDRADTRRFQGRRNITDPSIFQNEPSTIHAKDSPVLESHGTHGPPVLPSPLCSPSSISPFEIDFRNGVSSYPSTAHSDSPSANSYVTSAPPSSPPVPILVSNRPQRFSVAPSDRASTLIGSDNDLRGFASGEEDDMDFQSETVFDSLRTGATGSSNSGVRGPRIETIFDESPYTDVRKPKLVDLQELLQTGSFSRNQVSANSKYCIAEEEESLSTPVRAIPPNREEDFSTPVRNKIDHLLYPGVPSLPPETPASLSLGKLEWDANDLTRSTGRWAFDGEEGEDWDCLDEDIATNDKRVGPLLSSGLGLGPAQIIPTLPASIPLQNHDECGDRDTRSNIFDWSEQHSLEKDALEGSSPRPSTVHGKQGVDSRASRATGRRGPSALHLRSQSVPVTADTSAQREYGNTSSKLGPWGLGNKAVSEDWNDDFEFEEPDACETPGVGGRKSESTGAGIPDFVPKAIMERQASVHGQFSQVREFALMVEELKRLRAQASSLGIIEGPAVELWKEAEGIINLATQDDEEREYSTPRSPSSPRSNLDPFEEDSPATQSRRKSRLSASEEHTMGNGNSLGVSPTLSSVEVISKLSTPPPMRPRKESSAKAKSVLETIHQQRNNNDPLLNDVESRRQKKLPFDTTSLRDLVIRAGVVTRAIKEIVRKADNTPQPQSHHLSPPPEPLFSQIFAQPTEESPSTGKGRVSRSKSSNSFRSGTISGNENEINGHMATMTAV
ncbi:MAG: hypothetical protein M1830_008933 [Pleopsidium flavum]|nr:MAG: hypothetical protein M1830_008933 [Pleopsidium flavum]